MRFLLSKDLSIARIVAPWFVPIDQTRLEMYRSLVERLVCSPEKTFVCVAIEDNLVRGMAVAFERKNDVFIWQASSDNRTGNRPIVDRILSGIKSWAASRGFSRIAGIPNRAKKLWIRRCGFKESEENENEVVMEI